MKIKKILLLTLFVMGFPASGAAQTSQDGG